MLRVCITSLTYLQHRLSLLCISALPGLAGSSSSPRR